MPVMSPCFLLLLRLTCLALRLAAVSRATLSVFSPSCSLQPASQPHGDSAADHTHLPHTSSLMQHTTACRPASHRLFCLYVGLYMYVYVWLFRGGHTDIDVIWPVAQ